MLNKFKSSIILIFFLLGLISCNKSSVDSVQDKLSNLSDNDFSIGSGNVASYVAKGCVASNTDGIDGSISLTANCTKGFLFLELSCLDEFEEKDSVRVEVNVDYLKKGDNTATDYCSYRLLDDCNNEFESCFPYQEKSHIGFDATIFFA